MDTKDTKDKAAEIELQPRVLWVNDDGSRRVVWTVLRHVQVQVRGVDALGDTVWVEATDLPHNATVLAYVGSAFNAVQARLVAERLSRNEAERERLQKQYDTLRNQATVDHLQVDACNRWLDGCGIPHRDLKDGRQLRLVERLEAWGRTYRVQQPSGEVPAAGNCLAGGQATGTQLAANVQQAVATLRTFTDGQPAQQPLPLAVRKATPRTKIRPQEARQAAELRGRGMEWPEVAATMGRNPAALRRAVAQLDQPRRPRTRWTADMETDLRVQVQAVHHHNQFSASEWQKWAERYATHRKLVPHTVQCRVRDILRGLEK